MVREFRRKTLLGGAALFTAAAALIGGVYYFNSPFKRRSLEVDGQSTVYYEAGRGPDLVFLQGHDVDWTESLGYLKDSYRVLVVRDDGQNPQRVEKIADALKTKNPYLVAAAKDARAALELALQPRPFTAHVVLIEPVVDMSDDLARRLTELKRPILILRSRSLLAGKPAGQGLSARIPSAQLAIHTGPVNDLLSDDPRWVARKIQNFISFTSKPGAAL